jgi:UDP-N-acetylmuramate--alanine ligase
MIKPDLDLELPAELGSTHFVGIGGSGMSGIARLFLEAGHRVTGSDLRDTEAVRELREAGAEIFIGHDASHVGDADALVVTGALWENNPEYQEALRRGIPVLHRALALNWLISGHRTVSIAGAHGKSTSTGMLVTALRDLGGDPSFVNGGVISGYGRSSAYGADDLFVVEADESDGSFLLYDTAIALITNVDADHLDHYGTQEAFEDAFVTFAQNASEFVVASSDDAGTLAVTRRLVDTRLITFGFADDADVRIHSVSDEGDVSFAIDYDGETYPAQLAIPGAHNAINATGVFAILVELGYDPASVVEALETFQGTGRRFELRGTARGVRVFDDYAHHPTEVAAALQTARSVVGTGRIIAVHQPHLYSRTQMMAGDFAETYERLADHTVVLDVFGAREDPIPGVTGALVADRFADQSRVDYLPDWQQAAEQVAAIARDGDLVMTLSCGDVYRIIPQILGALESTSTSASTSASGPATEQPAR